MLSNLCYLFKELHMKKSKHPVVDKPGREGLVSSIVQKPGKLSDQSIQLLIGGWSGNLLLPQGIHSSRG